MGTLLVIARPTSEKFVGNPHVNHFFDLLTYQDYSAKNWLTR